MTITLLCGLQDEANIFRGTPGLQVLCGAAQRDNLDGLVPADCVALVSAGCAGALDPGLRVGDLLLASEVVRLDGFAWEADQAWRLAVAEALKAPAVPFFSHPVEVCATPDQRASIRTRLGTDVVDEESFAVADLAAERGLPFLVIRAISDTADQAVLPGDAQAQRPDGSEDVTAIIGDAFKDPAEAIREADGFGRSLDALRAAFRTLGPDFGFGNR